MRLGRVLLLALVATAAIAPVAAIADDWGVQRDPFDKKEIATYKRYLARNPHDAGALARLLDKYRRYRTVDLLKSEYQKQIDKNPKDWAALVVLGHLYRKTGDDPRALDNWNRAVALRDSDATTWIAIGAVHKASGKNKDARVAYDKALVHSKTKNQKKKALRALADLALATGDNDGADAYFKQFLALEPRNAQLWIERGDAMLAAGKHEVALDSYAHAEKLLGGDPSRRIDVVARRGQAFEGMGKDEKAVAEYRRAIKLAPKGYYLEVELTNRIIDIYRKKQGLPGLLAHYEKAWPERMRGHFEWSTLGKLYEETGAQDKAIHALKKAVQRAPTELDTQRRLITLLENSGRDDEALRQYEAVVRAAPGDARFQLELADRYQRRGRDKKALEALARLIARFPNDPGVLGAVADLYQRWGKEDLAIAQYERLAKLEPDDPSHLVALGEQYWQKGNRKRATETWKRLINIGKAAGYAKLGEVFNEHNMQEEALAQYAKAIAMDPKKAAFYKGRAQVWEAKRIWGRALADLDKVLELLGHKATDRMARREIRRRYVTIVTRYAAREPQYKKKWIDGFADGKGTSAQAIEDGYFLAEYYSRTGKQVRGQPERVLAALHKRVPDDQELTLELVKQYRLIRNFEPAIALLLELAKQVPSREAEVYNMIADIKIEQRKDSEVAIWRQKAIAKSPNSPLGYEKLAEGYVAMQKFPEAIAAYQKVLERDPRNTKALFALAQLHIQAGTPLKAVDLLRAVLRNSTSEEDVARAGREAIALEEMTDTLGELEKVLSPLAFMMAHKPVYRRVLVDLYLRYVPRLVERERHGTDDVKKAARAELARIGGHGLQPLLEALRDEKEPSHRAAVEVLGHLGNKGAAAPLVHLARQEPPHDTRFIGTLTEALDREVRVEALVAAGRLGDPRVLSDVLPLMDHPELAMREAATFTIGRSGDRRAVPALVKALGDRRPSVQTLACLGLAQIDDKRGVAAAISVVDDARRADVTRAACAYAIGARRASKGIPALLGALADNRGEAQRLAAWSLGQLGDARSLGPLVRAYYARAGRSGGELVWAIGRVSRAGVAPAQLSTSGDYPMKSGKFDPATAIAQIPGDLPHPATSTKLVVDHADDIAKGLLDALGEHRDVVVSVLTDLDSDPDRLSLGALSASASTDPKVTVAMEKIGTALTPAVKGQLASDDPKVRALAVSVIAKIGAPGVATAAIQKGLQDSADQVRAASMHAIAVLAHHGAPPRDLVEALTRTLANGRWADRRVAAQALGRIGKAGAPAALVTAAHDSSSFVREAVAGALGALGKTPGAVDALLALSRDEVAQVRAASARSLGQVKDPRARKRRGELERDPSPIVRQAAAH